MRLIVSHPGDIPVLSPGTRRYTPVPQSGHADDGAADQR